MIKTITIFIVLSLSANNFLFAQTNQFAKGGRVLVNSVKEMGESFYYIYEPSFLAKPIYNDTTEAENIYPEQLMISTISANSQEWINYNTYGGEVRAEIKDERFFEHVKNMNLDSNYFELRSKIQFILDNEQYAIIKFFIYSELLDDPKSGAYVMIKDTDGRWKKTINNFTSNLALMMMRFQEEKLRAILFFDEENNPLMQALLNKISVAEGVVDFSLLYKEFSRWYSDNDEGNLKYFIDENAW